MTCRNRGPALATIGFAVFFAVAFAAAKPAGATNFFCIGGDVPCLIAAINSANQGLSSDAIILDAGTYQLNVADNTPPEGANGLPVIRTPIQIYGAGPGATIIKRSNTASTFRIFEVASKGVLTLDSLAVQGGRLDSTDPNVVGGAGILNFGTTGLTNVMVFDNNEFLGATGAGGGGIRNSGNLAVYGSLVLRNSSGIGNGGGILNTGTMTIHRSSIRSNFAFRGAGVASGTSGGASTGNIIYSDIVANNGVFSAGVLSFGGLTIKNTTIANNFGQGFSSTNSVGGGVVAALGVVRLENCTVSGNFANDTGIRNSGGILIDGGTAEMGNTIVAKNFLNGDPSNLQDCSGPVSSLGHNILGTTTGCSIALLPSDFQGDPGIGAFTDGGPSADGYVQGNGRFPLLAGSRAIEAGDPGFGGPLDQLWFPRADGDLSGTATRDIGSMEFEPTVNRFVTLIRSDVVRDSKPLKGFPGGTETITNQYQNTSSEQIIRPVFVVAKLWNGSMVLNCDPPAPGGRGARLTPNVGADLIWSPNEIVTVQFVLGLQVAVETDLGVDVIGYPQ